MDYYLVIKTKKVPIHAITWMNLQRTPSAGSPSQKAIIARFHFYEMSKRGQSTETDSRLVVAWGWGRRGDGE